MMVSSELFLIHCFTEYCCNFHRKHDLVFLSVAVLHEVQNGLEIPIYEYKAWNNTPLKSQHLVKQQNRTYSTMLTILNNKDNIWWETQRQ